ncbi:MAG: phosphonoacetaldehyde reductase [Oscillospiraceae bacterium]|nr:phosphonoacetaldehyde reductase [Oscillospiraceae bacterium]
MPLYQGKIFQEKFAEILERERVKKPFLVCGKSFWCLPNYPSLPENTVYFTDFSPNPKLEEVHTGLALFLRERCDFIITVGGGSAIDVGKMVNVLESNAGEAFHSNQLKILPEPRAKNLAIPTTAGSGAEETEFAVVYVNGEKHSVSHPQGKPDYVLLNPQFLETLPTYQKKSTLLDALCQGIESMLSVKSTAESQKYAQRALELILGSYRAYLAGEKACAGDILEGANLAGKAINISQTTAAHAMSYKLGEILDIAHGHSAALCLREVWGYMRGAGVNVIDPRGKDHLNKVFKRLDGIFGVEKAQEKFSRILEEMKIHLPRKLTGEEINVLVSSINAQRLKNNPVEISPETARRIYSRL